MAIAIGYEGKSGAGKGEIAAETVAVAREMFSPTRVKTFDQGALYRMCALEAIEAGANDINAIVCHTLNQIEKDDTESFLDRYHEVMDDEVRRSELRKPKINSVVASIGESDKVQVFMLNMMNSRIGRACTEGAEVIVVDCRTPKVIAKPSVEAGDIEWALVGYMFTPSEISACWAALKNGEPYSANLDRLRKRNDDDERREAFPNFEPSISTRTEVTSLNYQSIQGRARGGSLWLPDAHLHVRNDGTFPLPELKTAMGGIVRLALQQATGEIKKI